MLFNKYIVGLIIFNSFCFSTISIDSKLELFVDKHIIEKMDNIRLVWHNPIKQPQSKFPLKKSSFMTVIKLDNFYIAYFRANNTKYKGLHKTGFPDKLTKYALSKNGIDWIYPKKNIIIKEPPFTHNFSPFLDKNSKINKNERFKALAGVDDNLFKRIKYLPLYSQKKYKEILEYWGYPKNYKSGLYSFVSQDGIHWKRKSKVPVITVPNGVKAFDSQNVSFWSEEENCYVCFFRSWDKEMDIKRQKSYWVRKVSKTTSLDFKHWTKPIKIKANLKGEQLYTSQVHPYFRAPHIYISLPTRFMSHRKGLTDVMFMSMRAGNKYFDREFKEAYIRPGMENKRWENRANYVALNVVPTSLKEISIYHSKSGFRYTLRTDGFASIHAGYKKGFILTKPFILNGKQLIVNYNTSAAGSLRVEVLDSKGKQIKDFIEENCNIMIGDEIQQKVIWKNIGDLKKLYGKVIKLKFFMKECDLYSFKID